MPTDCPKPPFTGPELGACVPPPAVWVPPRLLSVGLRGEGTPTGNRAPGWPQFAAALCTPAHGREHPECEFWYYK